MAPGSGCMPISAMMYLDSVKIDTRDMKNRQNPLRGSLQVSGVGFRCIRVGLGKGRES